MRRSISCTRGPVHWNELPRRTQPIHLGARAAPVVGDLRKCIDAQVSMGREVRIDPMTPAPIADAGHDLVRGLRDAQALGRPRSAWPGTGGTPTSRAGSRHCGRWGRRRRYPPRAGRSASRARSRPGSRRSTSPCSRRRRSRRRRSCLRRVRGRAGSVARPPGPRAATTRGVGRGSAARGALGRSRRAMLTRC